MRSSFHPLHLREGCREELHWQALSHSIPYLERMSHVAHQTTWTQSHASQRLTHPPPDGSKRNFYCVECH